MMDGDFVRQMFAQISDVVIFGRAVHDDVNSIRAPRDHQIVQYAPIAIKKQRIAHASVFQADDISGKQGFERFRSEEHTSDLQSLMRISYALFCLKKKNKHT